jgi:hypothetical protein
MDVAWYLSRAWPGSELYVVDDAGHSAGDPGMTETAVAALDRFARPPSERRMELAEVRWAGPTDVTSSP